MGTGNSRVNLKKCSCDELKDMDLPRAHTNFNNGKRNCKNYKDELCKHPNKYVLTRIPSMSTNNKCTCNTALTESIYSLDALTAEEQLDEVQRLFRENNKKRTGRKQRCVEETPPPPPPPICCNCVCNCGGGREPEPKPHPIERRNGLQKVGRCDGGCQCVLCSENDHMGELSEAEAIAEAIREYCCKQRERARGGGKSECKHCACKKQLAAENGKRRRQVMEKDIEADDENENKNDYKDATEEEEEVEVMERKEIMKEEIMMEERIQSRSRKYDLTEDDEEEEESANPRQRRKSNETAALNRNGKRASNDQKHAKSCKCCVCRKEAATAAAAATKDTDRNSDSDDDIISLDDIELEVQTDVLSADRDLSGRTSVPQNRRPSQENPTKANKCCTCDKATTTDFLQEAQVLMKRKRLVSESSEEIKPMQRRLSEEPRRERPTRPENCKCPHCQQKTKENERLARDAETNKKPKQWQNSTDQDPESRRSLPRRSEEDYTRRRSLPRRSEEDYTRRRISIDNEQELKVRETPARRSNDSEQEPKVRQTPARRRSIDIEQEAKERETPTRRSVQGIQQPQTESDSEAEQCYCFQRKRTQRKEGYENGCRKDCKCSGTKEQTAAAAKSHRDQRRSSSEPAGSDPRQPQRRRRNSEQVASHNRDNECQTICKCKKTQGVPLTKCCKCTDEMVESMARQHEEDMKRRKLAEVLAERLQKRAELQIALQKRLQEQMEEKQKPQRCCCEPQPFCAPCCKPMMQPNPIPMNCYEAPACCCQPTPCCFETPACCYEQPPCYGQECPCCCQPMPFSYSASCSYPEHGSC